MKEPLYQRIFRWILYCLAGFLALGAFLDAISNAISVISPPITYFGSVAIVLLWIIAEQLLRKYPLRWIISERQGIRIKSFGVKPRLALLGIIALLWIPRLVDGIARTPDQTKLDQSIIPTETIDITPSVALPKPVFQLIDGGTQRLELRFVSMAALKSALEGPDDPIQDIRIIWLRDIPPPDEGYSGGSRGGEIYRTDNGYVVSFIPPYHWSGTTYDFQIWIEAITVSGETEEYKLKIDAAETFVNVKHPLRVQKRENGEYVIDWGPP